MSTGSAAARDSNKPAPTKRRVSSERGRRRNLAKSVLSSKGQITVPVEVRRALGLRAGDQVAYRVVAGCAELVPVRGSILDAAGSVTGTGTPADRREVRRAVSKAVSARVAKEGR